MLFFEEIQTQLDELELEKNCEMITEGDFNTLNPNTAYMRKKCSTCVNYLFLFLL